MLAIPINQASPTYTPPVSRNQVSAPSPSHPRPRQRTSVKSNALTGVPRRSLTLAKAREEAGPGEPDHDPGGCDEQSEEARHQAEDRDRVGAPPERGEPGDAVGVDRSLVERGGLGPGDDPGRGEQDDAVEGTGDHYHRHHHPSDVGRPYVGVLGQDRTRANPVRNVKAGSTKRRVEKTA